MDRIGGNSHLIILDGAVPVREERGRGGWTKERYGKIIILEETTTPASSGWVAGVPCF